MSVRLFLDIQQLILDELATILGAEYVGIETPADLIDRLPFARVQRLGGPRTRLNDVSSVTVDLFAPTYAVGEPLIERICAHLVGPPTPIDLLDRITCQQSPIEVPWGDSADVRRWSTTFDVASRPRRFL